MPQNFEIDTVLNHPMKFFDIYEDITVELPVPVPINLVKLEINKVTAISGSGPGYIFLFIDAFEKAALQLGLGEKVTKQLVHQTLYGSIHLLFTEKESADVLANNIAIKGGTTEAALNQFKNNKVLHRTFKKVVKAAYLRANQLGK